MQWNECFYFSINKKMHPTSLSQPVMKTVYVCKCACVRLYEQKKKQTHREQERPREKKWQSVLVYVDANNAPIWWRRSTWGNHSISPCVICTIYKGDGRPWDKWEERQWEKEREKSAQASRSIVPIQYVFESIKIIWKLLLFLLRLFFCYLKLWRECERKFV